MADWADSVITIDTGYRVILDLINARAIDAAQLFSATPQNPKAGFVRFVRLSANKVKIQEYDGSAWIDKNLEGLLPTTPAAASTAKKYNLQIATDDTVSWTEASSITVIDQVRTSSLRLTSSDQSFTGNIVIPAANVRACVILLATVELQRVSDPEVEMEFVRDGSPETILNTWQWAIAEPVGAARDVRTVLHVDMPTANQEATYILRGRNRSGVADGRSVAFVAVAI